mmetsp:Transcript_27467/g.60113  ORF Transcript_27467/g.60113 Transcript_27467/m.60113 type:complete len:504 (+) Transcript_27467:59-1570(+)
MVEAVFTRECRPRVHGRGARRSVKRRLGGLAALLGVVLAASNLGSTMPLAVAVISAETKASYFCKSFYHASILPLLGATVALAWLARPSISGQLPEGFSKFRSNYLSVWCLCVAADWLQGPYVYALYAAYGYSGREIAQLFVTGFLSSMVFGCVVGTVADKFGRKRTCLAYCIFYIVSCLTKHCNNYWTLMFGRLTGGIATSMLFSAFECWMVSEHTVRHHFSGDLLSYMFGLMFSLMYCVAIVSGFVSQSVVDHFPFRPVSEGSAIHVGGFTCPFDLSILCLIAGFSIISLRWDENFGGGGASGKSMLGRLSEACQQLKSMRVTLLGLVVACFEGAMFAFVFNWTPALDVEGAETPHGLIFAAFMMACMCGASSATVIGSSLAPAARLALVLALATVSLAAVAAAAGVRELLPLCFGSFLVFEFCVGVYFPAVGILKSEVVPENVRTTVYNLYRIPLNAVVVGLLLSNVSVVQCFRFSAVLVAVALAGMFGLSWRVWAGRPK